MVKADAATGYWFSAHSVAVPYFVMFFSFRHLMTPKKYTNSQPDELKVQACLFSRSGATDFAGRFLLMATMVTAVRLQSVRGRQTLQSHIALHTLHKIVLA